MRKILLLLSILFLSYQTFAQFTTGRLVVVRTGTGTGALTGAATPLFLDEYDNTGTPGVSVALPTATTGSVNRITGSGSATSENQLNLSADGNYLTLGGYDAAVGLAGVVAASGVNRVAARVAADGTVATTVLTVSDATAANNTYSANNFRSVITTDGTRLWLGGNGTASTGGVRTAAFTGSTTPVTSTQVSSTIANIRTVNIFNNQLYFSTGSGTTGIYAAGTGLPVTTGNTSTLKMTVADPYAYSFVDRGNANVDCYVAGGTGNAVLKFSSVDNGSTWTARGSVATGANVYGIAARIESGNPVLYVTTANSIIKLTDATAFDAAIAGTFTTLATAGTNTAFRGIAFAPNGGVAPPANNLSLTFSAVAASSPIAPPSVTTTLSDPTDPLKNNGVLVDVKDNSAAIPATDYTLTAASSNTTVVPTANVAITKADGQATVKVTAAAAGYSTITLTLTRGSFTKTLALNIAASAGAGMPSVTRFHSGSSDASAAIAIDDTYMIVADDEMNKLAVYNRTASGLPVTTFDYSGLLNLTDLSGGVPREVDVEAGVRSIGTANRIYWLGSLSNSATSFAARPNRNRLFALTATGTGTATSFAYTGRYDNLRQDLIAWGDAAGYDFTTAAAAGKDPKAIDGFNVEGLTIAPDNTTAYIAFRAPLVPTANRTKAVIAPLLNFETWFNNGSPAGSPTFGAPIELALGGRGFRDIVKLTSGNYVILAGNYDDLPLNPAVFTWNGNATTAPVQITSFNLTDLNPEAAMEIKSGGTVQADRLQVLSDNGSVVYYGDGVEAKDLTQNNFKKFRSDVLITGTGSPLPITLKSFTVDRSSNTSLLKWEVGGSAAGTNFTVERSVNGRDFAAIGTVAGFGARTEYGFADAAIAAGKIYYRIAITDGSGRAVYSAIRMVNSGTNDAVTVYPNPVTNGLFTISTSAGGLKYVALFNAAGSKVKEVSFTSSVADITTNGLAKGSYTVVVATKEKLVATKTIAVQ